MNRINLNKKDFLPTGAAELPPFYLRFPAVGAAKSINGILFFYFLDGIGYGFAFKKGVINLKDSILESSFENIEQEFLQWKKKWEAHDNEFYSIATETESNWKENWKRLDDLGKQYWIESYKVESLDNFSEDIEKMITQEIMNKRMDKSILHDLISPEVLIKPQEIANERRMVVRGEMSREEYIRKNWFTHGNWAGGDLLDEKLLSEDLAHLGDEVDLDARRRIHQAAHNAMQADILNTIKIVRLLTVWREERKTHMQKISLGYKRIADCAARELGVDRSIIEWSLFEDIETICEKQDDIKKRRTGSVLIFDEKSDGKILTEKESKEIIDEFSKAEEVTQLIGTIACKGNVQGKVSVIMKKDDFPKFSLGDILVTTMTRPEFLPVMKLASAIVTDEGGLTCHAAIVSRELNVPCIVGTKDATKILKDGYQVEVNANEGFVQIKNA